MLPTVYQGALNGFFHTVINAFVSPTNDGGLLSQIDSVTMGAQIDAEKFSYLLIPVFASTIIQRLVRYILGHVVFTTLTLESLNMNNAKKKEEKDPAALKMQAPTLRSLRGALSYLYSTGGVFSLFKGFPFGIIYWVLQWYIARYLRLLLFSPFYLHPVAHAISTVLLAELHCHWTQRMISNVALPNLRPRWARWCTVATAALVQVTAETLVSRLPGYLSVPAVVNPTQEVVLRDAKAAVVLLFVRLVVYIPASVMLVIVETSFLSEAQGTTIPSGKKKLKTETKQHQQRGARIGEILSNHEGPLPIPLSRAWKMLRPSMCLWLLALYVKMCFVLLFVEFVCFMSIYLSV